MNRYYVTMICPRNLFFVTLFSLISLTVFSQRNFDEYNRLGINGGVTFFDIQSDELKTEAGTGFMVGFTTRGSFRGNFDLIYGINFYNHKLSIAGNNLVGTDSQKMGYTIQGVQLNFLPSINIIKHHLSIEVGPILQVNGKMKLDSDRYDEYIIDGYTTLNASEIEDISQVNFHVLGGITAGFEDFRLGAHYQYGVTNTLKGLNDKELSEDVDFEGHASLLTVSAVFYF